MRGLIELQKKQMMGAKGVTVLVLFFFQLCNLSQTLPVVHLQANTEYKGEQECLNNAKGYGNIIPRHGRKLQHAVGGRGVTGGQVAGAGGDGNGGGSHSNYPQGGAVIPLYAAGAANAHRSHHHSAGSCIHLSAGPSTLTTVLLAYLLLTNPYAF